MNRHSNNDPDGAPVKLPRRARLHSLVFAGAALGTTLLALGAAAGPKFPPFSGE